MATAPSFWLDQLGSRSLRPALAGDREADVCIVGGGFTGLWTAYELRRADPGIEVVVLEARQVGFGASGRNGGWVLGKLSGAAAAWNARGGPGAAARMERAIQDTVGEIGAAVEREGIACDWRQGGTVTVAQTDTQMERLRQHAAGQRAQLGEDLAWQVLDAEQLSARIAVAGARGGLYSPHCARVQPAELVTGLAVAAERAGATIHESTPVTSLAPGAAVTPQGRVRARYVLRATEGYTADLPGSHRTLLPMNSSMIVTEPLGDAAWAEIGWEGAETMLDGSHLYTYSQRTADGRIAIGGRGVPYRFGSRTDREGPVPARTVQELRARLLSLFPGLGGVAVARAWHGILGVSRDWCPTVGLDRATGLGHAGGYAGEGVAASNLAARTLRDLVLGRDTELTRLPWVGDPARDWEPEPLRFMGARGIYTLYRLADRQERGRSHSASLIAAAADRIAGR
ncbi:MAG TPA: FAD-binding oxidoreductase [Solirubrobacteraceae bacterium]|nr:FAD-binding oxidoreductase [Solirubrobacteraceae bacterium]